MFMAGLLDKKRKRVEDSASDEESSGTVELSPLQEEDDFEKESPELVELFFDSIRLADEELKTQSIKVQKNWLM